MFVLHAERFIVIVVHAVIEHLEQTVTLSDALV
jgi:hypothetical protein